MKLQYRQIEPFVKKPDPAARAVLIYGPDDGLMRERSKAIGLSVVADINDPFNAVTLPENVLLDDPARLQDEACAMSLMGGSRLIRIEGASDKLTTLLKEYLKAPSPQNLVVLEAGELGKNSPLRRLFENSNNAAALPCYIEDERDLAPVIRDMLRDAGYMIEPDALALLAQSASGDRRRVRAETEKLVLYMNKAGNTITFDDVQACCADTGSQSLDTVVFGAGGGRPEACLRAYGVLMQEGIPVITVLRALQNHFRRLHLTKARIDRGENVMQIMKSLSPPVFYKHENDFKSQIQKWSSSSLEKILGKLAALEAQCKTTGAADETLCAQALLSLSRSKG